jgi:hypothetical protein
MKHPARIMWLAPLLACGCTPAGDRERNEAASVSGNRAQQESYDDDAGPVRLALLPPSREGDAAAAQGVLEVDGPCLYLRSADGSRFLLALMTFDTRWEDERLKIGDRSYAPGERVTVGGSEAAGAIADLAWVQPPDPSCDIARIWITVSVDRAVGQA